MGRKIKAWGGYAAYHKYILQRISKIKSENPPYTCFHFTLFVEGSKRIYVIKNVIFLSRLTPLSKIKAFS